ncbi:Uncharacterized protein TCM_023358 [Theobroma cacao]|uniref:HAT C-terminal dimerisation domain-containing protein n=1 Tax=Theobroma cacao TaxID=3641 RepID=A0A061EU39_THECC|nr:Uncharacterized protein TCM_023358 [Theobroma cacao]
MNLVLFVVAILDQRKKLSYVEFTLLEMYPCIQASMMFSLVTKTMDELFHYYRNMLQLLSHVGESGQEYPTSIGQGTSGGCRDSVASTLIGKDSKCTKKRLDRFKNHRLNTRSKVLKTELEKYVFKHVDDEGFDDDEFDVLMWWKFNQFRFLVLVAIACDVLAILVSTVASESIFNTNGHVLDAYRSSLTLKVM